MKNRTLALSAVAILGILLSGSAGAVAVLCQNLANNHMLVDSQYVSACIDAGLGNIGNGQNDDFFQANPGYLSAGYTDITSSSGASFVQTQNTGSFSIDSSLWNSYSTILIGFKFGTGNTPDEWFVYSLQNLISSGFYTFEDVLAPGASTAQRLSHLTVYGLPGQQLPEPSSLLLIGIGILALATGMTRKRALA